MNVEILTGLTILLSLLAIPPVIAGAEPRELLLAADSVPKEAYEKRIIPAFVRQWKQKTGETIQVRSSFAASGAQTRAVVGGLDADIAALSLESDLQQLVKAGLVTHDRKQGPHNGIVTTSIVALGVRKGNPKAIQGWEDLTKPGVEVLYPSPKTSGGAMWDVIAIYGAGLHHGKQQGLAGPSVDQHAIDLVERVQRHVKVMDKSGRESVTTFEQGVGDVIVTYENELLPRIKQGRPYELVFPAETVVVENPVAVIDRNADRHHVRDLAVAFVSFHNGEKAQQAFVEFGFRPTNEAVQGLCIYFRPSTVCIYGRRSRGMGPGLRRTVQSARSRDESRGGNTIVADCPIIRNAWRAHALTPLPACLIGKSFEQRFIGKQERKTMPSVTAHST